MYNLIEPSKTWSLLGCSALLLAGCLDQNGGMMDTTNVHLTTGTDASSGGAEDDTSTTFPPIMTTTQDPGGDTTSSSGDASTGSTGEEPPVSCGDGIVQDGEECDDAEDNADEAACTTFCKHARCGDGLLHKGAEQCDDGADNGQYDACNISCSGLGPRCGDSVVQADKGELCDATDPKSGCLKNTCQWAASCLELKNAWGAAAVSDSGYKILRNGKDLTVYCDMDTDGGGYTFLKYSNANNVKIPAKDADAKCEQYGMHLFVPRSQGHLDRAVAVAENAGLVPLGGGLDGDVNTYLRILGIYPVVAGQSCAGMPLNSEDCAQWQALDQKRYWVSGDKITDGQPAPVNCTECSMAYYWDSMTNKLQAIEAIWAGGVGADSPAFLCDPADKTE